MYSLVSAVGRIKGVNNPWKSLSIASMSVYSLLRDYEEVYVKLTNTLYQTSRILKLTDIKALYQYDQQNFTAFLTSLGNASLPTVAGDVSVTTKFARYSDVIRAGYKIHTLGENLVINTNVPEEDRDHIALTRSQPATTYSDLGKYCIAVVNGLIHRLDYNSQMAVIYGANKHSRSCGRYEVGIISFKTVGEILCIPITEDMIGKRHANTPLSSKLYLTLAQDYPDYRPMLVLGGYLYPADPKTFYNVAERTYCLETGKISMLARFMDAREKAGYDVPVLETSQTNEHLISVEELLSDDKIIELATAKESFFLLVKTDNLYSSRLALPKTKIAGDYRIPQQIFENKPMIGGYGLFVNYWHKYEDGMYSIKTTLRYQTRYNFLTTDDRSLTAVDDNGYSGDPFRFTEAFFLTLASDTLSITTS